ncbi:MAG TPA: oxygenase MpaB family protein [Terriglobales bacterium]|nr:oxygenase MpaB family protein [Terriglobales bacterium]
MTDLKKTKMADSGPPHHYFSPDMMIWRIDREKALLLAGGRALLMQLAHPKVASGVAQHSHFEDDPLGRLHRTMSSMWSIVFDEVPAASAALERVKSVHKRVHGTVKAGESLPAGAPYDALDVNLLLWVHATLIDSALLVYDLFVKRLTHDERSRYYEDSKILGRLFEIPESLVPPNLEGFNQYVNRMLTGDEVAVGPTAKSLAAEILHPRPWILKPAGPLFRLITAGLLPEPLREAYGLRWDDRMRKYFSFVIKSAGWLIPILPGPVRIVPNARRSENHLSPRK